MPVFEFKAYETSGTRVQDTIEAASERDAFRRLASRGLTVAGLKLVERRIKERKMPAASGGGGGFFRRKLKLDDVVVLCRELAIMVGAGVAVTEALQSSEENATHPALKAALSEINAEIADGSNMSDALRNQSKIFPTYFCDIVRAAEEGGRLDMALETGAAQMEQAMELRRKVIGAMLYPCLLMGIAGLTAGVLVTFVLPRFSKIFANMGAKVPATTKALLSLSEFMQGHWYYVLGGGIFALFVFKRLLKKRAFATAWTQVLMRVPLMGDVMRKLAVARSLSVLSSMLTCNVPLLSAMRHAARTSGNNVMEDGMNWAAERVEGGKALSDSFREVGVVPHIVVQMSQVGEKTGELASVMSKTASFFESDVDNRLKSLVSVIEPIMIVALGVFIGFIALSVITPIYSLVGSVK